MPNAQASARNGSCASPAAVSGDMYAGVPTRSVTNSVSKRNASSSSSSSSSFDFLSFVVFFCRVRRRGNVVAHPKSASFATTPPAPSSHSSTFSGFTSLCAMPRACTNASAFKRSRAMSRVRSKESAGNAYPTVAAFFVSPNSFFAVAVAVAVAFVAVLAKASAASRTARFRSPRSAYSSTSAACAARGSCTTSRNPTTFTCETRSSRNRRSASSSRSNGVDRRFRIDTLEGPASGPSSRSQSRGLGNVRVWFLSTRLTTTGRFSRSTSRHRNVEAVAPAPNAESTRYLSPLTSSDPSSPEISPASLPRDPSPSLKSLSVTKLSSESIMTTDAATPRVTPRR